MFTLDASVFLRRASPNDPDFVVCHDLLEVIKKRGVPLYEPLLVLAEVAGAVSRLFRDPMRGRPLALRPKRWLPITFCAVQMPPMRSSLNAMLVRW